MHPMLPFQRPPMPSQRRHRVALGVAVVLLAGALLELALGAGPFPFVVPYLVLAAVLGTWAWRGGRRDAWLALAEDRGFETGEPAFGFLSRPETPMEGRVEGVPVRLRVVRDVLPSGAPHRKATRVTVRIPRLDEAFHVAVRPRNLWSRVFPDRAGEEVETGDGPFDEGFEVRSSHPGMARQLLDEGLRNVLKWTEAERPPVLAVEEGVLRFEVPGIARGTRIWRHVLGPLARLARTLRSMAERGLPAEDPVGAGEDADP